MTNTTQDKIIKYRLIDYFDVWGNQEDGWEVNDICDVTDTFGYIFISEEATDEEIIDYMILIEYFCPQAKETVYVENTYDGVIVFLQKETDMPLGVLEVVI